LELVHPSWWPEFLHDHQQRHPQLPKPSAKEAAGFYNGLLANLARADVLHFDLLTAASEALMLHKHQRTEHVALFIAQAKAVRGTAAATQITPSDIAERLRFDREADAQWGTMWEAAREHWRDRTRLRFKDWILDKPSWVESIAKGWAYEPTFFPDEPPTPVPGSVLGPPAAEPPVIDDEERIRRRQEEQRRQLDWLMARGGHDPAEPAF
jgi:hypothetical protein